MPTLATGAHLAGWSAAQMQLRERWPDSGQEKRQGNRGAIQVVDYETIASPQLCSAHSNTSGTQGQLTRDRTLSGTGGPFGREQSCKC